MAFSGLLLIIINQGGWKPIFGTYFHWIFCVKMSYNLRWNTPTFQFTQVLFISITLRYFTATFYSSLHSVSLMHLLLLLQIQIIQFIGFLILMRCQSDRVVEGTLCERNAASEPKWHIFTLVSSQQSDRKKNHRCQQLENAEYQPR